PAQQRKQGLFDPAQASEPVSGNTVICGNQQVIEQPPGQVGLGVLPGLHGLAQANQAGPEAGVRGNPAGAEQRAIEPGHAGLQSAELVAQQRLLPLPGSLGVLALLAQGSREPAETGGRGAMLLAEGFLADGQSLLGLFDGLSVLSLLVQAIRQVVVVV